MNEKKLTNHKIVDLFAPDGVTFLQGVNRQCHCDNSLSTSELILDITANKNLFIYILNFETGIR